MMVSAGPLDKSQQDHVCANIKRVYPKLDPLSVAMGTAANVLFECPSATRASAIFDMVFVMRDDATLDGWINR
jgi:hypothetical protein